MVLRHLAESDWPVIYSAIHDEYGASQKPSFNLLAVRLESGFGLDVFRTAQPLDETESQSGEKMKVYLWVVEHTGIFGVVMALGLVFALATKRDTAGKARR